MNFRYDRDGRPISLEQWRAYIEDLTYMRVGFTRVMVDNGAYDVSTIWIGLDSGTALGTPLIFETLVFAYSGSVVDVGVRYSRLEDAQEGHRRMVQRWQDKFPGAETVDLE